MSNTRVRGPFPAALLRVVLGGIALFSGSALAALGVVSSTPAKNAVGVAPNSAIVLNLSQPIDPTTVTSQIVRVMGRYSGPAVGTLALDAAQTQITFTPTRPFFVSEWVTVYVSSGLKATTGETLTGGFYLTFSILGGQSSKNFTLTQTVTFKQPGESLIRLYGFSAVDIDGDGSPDMSAADEYSSDVRVRLNDGCGHPGPSKTVPLPAGQEPSPNVAADLNGDGRPDLVTGNQTGDSVAVFLNNGQASYSTPQLTSIGGGCHGVALLDIDADGDLDVLATNLNDVRVLKNDGLGHLANTVGYNAGGVGEWQVATTDANLDGRADAYVANNGSGSIGLLTGNASGGLTLSATKSVGPGAWAVAAGDLDGDGDGDCVVTNNGNATISVARSNGVGGFLAAIKNYSVGAQPVSAHLADLDGDADLDLSIACFGSANCYLFFNQGGTFTQAAVLPAKFAGSCSSLVDFDRDGDADVIVTDELSDEAYVFTQDGPTVAKVQSPTCEAALRIDNYALRSGFGTIPPHPERIGGNVYVDLSGLPNQPWLLLVGTAATYSSPTAPGWFNLSFSSPLVFLASGFSGGPFVTDSFGEARFSTTLPSLPVGLVFTMQGAVGNPAKFVGASFTNPESILVQP